jgi:GNAT superfamily N-acetyltransferase
MKLPENITLITVNADNVEEHGVFCIKNKKAKGYKAKVDWFKKKFNEGLEMIQVIDLTNKKQLGFIEFLPSENAWRPISAKNYLFIHCIALFSKDIRNKNIGSILLQEVINQAKNNGKDGVCAMSSTGPWMANKSLYLKNGFSLVSTSERFELMVFKLVPESQDPEFLDWAKELPKYKGWNLIYSDQCPWHDKAVTELYSAAASRGIDLKVRKLENPEEAQNAPIGYGTFALINNGKLLADHYISRTRVENILKEELT